MSNKLVECIANFSEARRPEVVDAIEDAIRAVQMSLSSTGSRITITTAA